MLSSLPSSYDILVAFINETPSMRFRDGGRGERSSIEVLYIGNAFK
jgi:hypothetical protein